MKPILLARALMAGVRLAKDTSRFDEALAIGRSLATPEQLAPLVAAAQETEQGRDAIRDRYRVGKISLAELGGCPAGTLGRSFADHMAANDLRPEDIPLLGDANDSLYVRAHLRESHDIWHVVTDFGADVEGELGLQAFYLAQLPFRFASAMLIIGLINQLLYDPGLRTTRMDSIARGWILGRRAKPLFGMRWGGLWNVPLTKIRADLGLPTDPRSFEVLAS